MDQGSERVAAVNVVVRDRAMADRVNEVLSRHGGVIRGRLGLPFPERGISVISLIVVADADAIGALAGALGNISGVTLRSTMLV